MPRCPRRARNRRKHARIAWRTSRPRRSSSIASSTAAAASGDGRRGFEGRAAARPRIDTFARTKNAMTRRAARTDTPRKRPAGRPPTTVPVPPHTSWPPGGGAVVLFAEGFVATRGQRKIRRRNSPRPAKLPTTSHKESSLPRGTPFRRRAMKSARTKAPIKMKTNMRAKEVTEVEEKGPWGA